MREGGVIRATQWPVRNGERNVQLVDVFLILSALPFISLLLFAVSLVRLASRRRNSTSDEVLREDAILRQQASAWDEEKPFAHKPVIEPELGLRGAIEIWLSWFLHQAMAVLINSKRLNVVLELRNRHYLLLDTGVFLATPAIAMTMRQEGVGWFPESLSALYLYTGVALAVKVGLFYLFGLYGRYWPYASISDVSRLIVAAFQCTLILFILVYFAHPYLLPYQLAVSRSLPLIDGMLIVLAAGGIRFSLRGLYDWHHRYRNRRGGRSLMIVGAGEAGMMAVREIWSNARLKLEPVAFIDDDIAKVGTYVHGLPVLGTSADIQQVVDACQIQRILIAIPSASPARLHTLVDICRQTGLAVDTLPGVYQILAGHKTISPLPEIDIHRILKRDPVVVDNTALTPVLEGKRVMITGAGGSIGGELSRQIALHRPAEMILLGHGENSIFEINLELVLRHPGLKTHQVIADVRDARRIDWAVRTYQPELVFHAAAHKHVPFMEDSLPEAVMNNVGGTRNVLRSCSRHGVPRFVLISTDKAINPANIMGVTKRIAELLTLATARQTGHNYSAVRFGNVLGSRGSVIPVFQRQIAAGGPVTVTHPNMYRYFMTIPEAVQLVLQSVLLGEGGEIFVMDMGEQVRILDLAVDLIRLSGFEPGRDIHIVFSGARPGEKMREELFFPQESFRRTRNEKIFVAIDERAPDLAGLDLAVDMLLAQTGELEDGQVVETIRKIVPEYWPYNNGSGASRITVPSRRRYAPTSPSYTT